MSPKPLLIATRNKGKIPEIQALLGDLALTFLILDDVSSVSDDFEVEEPALTFEGNAIIKAIGYGQKAGLLTLADDSGLEVFALHGAPGVHSSRYVFGADADRYNALLTHMKDIPEEKRDAQFRSVICVYDPETDKVRTTAGRYSGEIIFEPRGDGGFGYDPIFFDPKYNKTLAEMTDEEKNHISHRARALQAMKPILQTEFLA